MVCVATKARGAGCVFRVSHGSLVAVLTALPLAFGTDLKLEDAATLPIDDECTEGGVAEDGSCSFNAVQLRALSSQRSSSTSHEAGHAAVLSTSCDGPWCSTLERFNAYFDTMSPPVMQQGFDKYTEWPSKTEGIKIAVTKHDYYEMYHGNVNGKLSQYLPQGYFGWDFKKLGTELVVRNQTEDTVVVTRNGTITFNLGWWMRKMFWNGCVKSLAAGQDFDTSEVTEFNDCHECPALLEYTLKKGGLSGKEKYWKIVDLVLLKLK